MDPKLHRPKVLSGLAIALFAASLLLIWFQFRARKHSDQAPPLNPPPSRHSSASRPSNPPHPPLRSATERENPSRSLQARPDIATQLAANAEVTRGIIKGPRIDGPVRVTGTFAPSTVTPSGSADDATTERFTIVANETGEVAGPFSVSASSAIATNGGVQFTGPIRLVYQGDVGQWYEIRSDSPEAYFFLSSDGSKNLFGAPGDVVFGSPDPSDPMVSGH